jgi:hypothetical protein
MFGLSNGNKKTKFIGPKAMNRQQLLIQNLIFVFIAVIIILILGFIIISELKFLVDQINLSLKANHGSSEVTSFNLNGLDLVKNKLPAFVPEITPIPNSTSTDPFATSTISVSTSTMPTILPEVPSEILE